MPDARPCSSSWLAALGWACLAGALLGSCETVDYSESVEHAGPIQRVVIASDIGDVSVRGADAEGARLERSLAGWKGAVRASSRVVDGVLYVESGCAGWWDCRVDVEIVAPAGAAIEIESGAGDVTLSGLRGEVSVELGAGALTGEGLGGERVQAAVASGEVDLTLSDDATEVRLAIGSGDAFLEIPAAACSGDFDLASGALSLDGVALVHASEGIGCALEATIAAGDLHLLGG